MAPTLFAIDPWIYFALPLMVILPVFMIVITRLVAGFLGGDSFRLRSRDHELRSAKTVSTETRSFEPIKSLRSKMC